MDRREALKKLGVGGAAIATASVVVSQPAFAYDAPTITPGGNISVIVVSPGTAVAPVGSRFDIVVARYPTATCPGSAINTPLPPGTAFISERTVTVTPGNIGAGSIWWANADIMSTSGAPGSAPRSGTTTFSAPNQPIPGLLGRVRKRAVPTPDDGSVVALAGESFSINVTLRFTCFYSGENRSASTTFGITYIVQ